MDFDHGNAEIIQKTNLDSPVCTTLAATLVQQLTHTSKEYFRGIDWIKLTDGAISEHKIHPDKKKKKSLLNILLLHIIFRHLPSGQRYRRYLRTQILLSQSVVPKKYWFRVLLHVLGTLKAHWAKSLNRRPHRESYFQKVTFISKTVLKSDLKSVNDAINS